MYFSSAALLLSLPVVVNGATKQFNPIESLFSTILPQQAVKSSGNRTRVLDPFAPSPAEREAERQARRRRMRERNERVKEVFKNVRPQDLEKVPQEDLDIMDSPTLRKLGWGTSSGGELSYFVDPGEDYDMWSQAYRMLGGFIDCDNRKDDDGGSHDGDGDGGGGACSRWMMWASYVDPNYQGNGYDEYFGDEPVGTLDCHRPDTEWQLMGVYRQEFYQFIEQISKHVWAIDDYEYAVALAGLAYMTDDDCYYVGASSSGESIYAGVAPEQYGKFKMALYTDDYCLFPNNDLGMTFDDFGLTSDVSLYGSGDGGDDDGGSWAQEWWEDTQEYTLTQLNEVYDSFRYCTSCIDYPTYQDGYVIGDDGTDEDDLINQCWKFYSHDSFTCESDCLGKGHAQGTILSIDVGGKFYGSVIEEFWDESNLQMGENSSQVESNFSRLLANVFVTFSFVVFIATFLAFAVARRSRYRESRSSKARRLLGSRSSSRKRSKRRSKSREADGVMRSSSSGRRKSSRSRSKSKSRDRGRDYDPPRTED